MNIRAIQPNTFVPHSNLAPRATGLAPAGTQLEFGLPFRGVPDFEPFGAGPTTAAPNGVALDFSGVPALDQGTQNSCGTTSLAMIFDFLGRGDITQSAIDREIRRTNLWGTAPTDLVEFARANGLSAGMYNQSTLDEVRGHLAAGRPVMVALDDPYSNGSDGGPKDHYVIVTGIETDAAGNEFVKIRDPNGANNPNAGRLGGGADYRMPKDEFLKKWGKTFDGYDNFMLVFGKPGENLPSDRLTGVEHSIHVAESYRVTANNIDRMFSPDDVPSFVRGLATGIPSIIPGLVSGVGWGVSFAGKKLTEISQNAPFVLKQLGLIGGGLVDGVGQFLTNIGAGVSGGIDQIGGGLEKLLHGDVKGFFEGIGGGLWKMGKGVVEGVYGFTKSLADGVYQAGKSAVKTIVDTAKTIGNSIADGAKAVGNAIADGAKAVGNAVVDGVKAVGSAIASGVKKIFSGW